MGCPVCSAKVKPEQLRCGYCGRSFLHLNISNTGCQKQRDLHVGFEAANYHPELDVVRISAEQGGSFKIVSGETTSNEFVLPLKSGHFNDKEIKIEVTVEGWVNGFASWSRSFLKDVLIEQERCSIRLIRFFRLGKKSIELEVEDKGISLSLKGKKENAIRIPLAFFQRNAWVLEVVVQQPTNSDRFGPVHLIGAYFQVNDHRIECLAGGEVKSMSSFTTSCVLEPEQQGILESSIIEYKGNLCLCFGEPRLPKGRVELSIPFIIESKTGLGEQCSIAVDFGTTNTTVAILSVDSSAKQVIDVQEIDYGGTYKVMPSVFLRSDSDIPVPPHHVGFLAPQSPRLKEKHKTDIPALVEKKDVLNAISGVRVLVSEALRRVLEKSADRGFKLVSDRLAVAVPSVFIDPWIDVIARAAKRSAFSVGLFDDRHAFVVPVDEPWAAFRGVSVIMDPDSWSLALSNCDHVIVWDMGGGTTDVAMFRRAGDGSFNEMVAFSGDIWGGSDITNTVAKVINRDGDTIDLRYAHRIKESFDDIDRCQELLSSDLSRLDILKKVTDAITDKIDGIAKDLRQVFDRSTNSNAGLNEKLNTILLLVTGGTSRQWLLLDEGNTDQNRYEGRVPELVRQIVAKHFSCDVNVLDLNEYGIDPKQCTAIGTAELLSENRPLPVFIENRAKFSLYFKDTNGVHQSLVLAGERLPKTVSITQSTVGTYLLLMRYGIAEPRQLQNRFHYDGPGTYTVDFTSTGIEVNKEVS